MKNQKLIKGWSLGIILILAIFFHVAKAEIASHDNTYLRNVAQQILLLTDQETMLRHKIEQLRIEQNQFNQKPPATYKEAKVLGDHIHIQVEMTNILVDELSQSLINVQKKNNKLTEFKKNLQVQLINEQLQEAKEVSTDRLHYADKLISLNQKETYLLSNNLLLARKLKEGYRQYLSHCLGLMELMEKNQMIQSIHRQITEENQSIDYWLQRMDKVNKSSLAYNTKKTIPLGKQIIEQSYLFYYTQQVHLSKIRIVLLDASINEKRMDDDFKNVLQEESSNLNVALLKDRLVDEEHTLVETFGMLKQYRQLMNKQDALLRDAVKNNWLNASKVSPLERNLNDLKNVSENLEKALLDKQKIVQIFQLKLQDYNTKMVAQRQAILKNHGEAGFGFGFLSELAGLPKLLVMYLCGLWEQVWHGLTLMAWGMHLLVGTILTSSLFIWWFGRKYFSILSLKMLSNRQRTASNILYILSELFRRNWMSLCLFIDGWFILKMTGMNFNAYLGLFYTAIIWFCFRVIMGVSRILLVERENEVDSKETRGQDANLYHRLKWVFIIGGWATVLVVLSKQLDIGGMVMEVSNRLFMAFLLTVSIVLIRARHVIPSLLEPLFLNRKYLSRTVRTVCWFLPFGFLVSTALGLLGYINLSWVLIYYQAALALVIASYIIVRGLAVDLFDILSEWMIRRLNQGWLWSEAFLKPIDRLFRIFLFFTMLVAISLVLGWGDDSLVVSKIRELFHHQFFRFSGINVTVFSIIEFVALVSFFFWLAKWTREFSHRWLFRNAKDIGVRNSLAVFCQYIIITLGTIITLQILGIDFTGLSMILGGLAVGLGFGLRDFANSIVGGIMILIERSVKEGDIVSIGEYEGEVTHIGIRAMCIRSWDHMEIMVPNSEILMKTFMNWTHQDSIVRTVIPMKIHRVDNPIAVQKMILDVLKKIPEVLSYPVAEVFFTNIDALIEFEIRYFINISLFVRAEIRSKVVLAVLVALKEAGIRAPHSQQDLYLHEQGTYKY